MLSPDHPMISLVKPRGNHQQDDSLCCLAVSCSLVSHNHQMNHKYHNYATTLMKTTRGSVSERGQQGTQTKPSKNAPHVLLAREGTPGDANKPN